MDLPLWLLLKTELRKVKRPIRIRSTLAARFPRPDWKAILAADRAVWADARTKAASGPRVIIASSVGALPTINPLASTLAVALTLRGANVQVLLCDGFLPACERAAIYNALPPAEMARNGPRSLCSNCFAVGRAAYESLGLPVHHYSLLVTKAERSAASRVAAETPFATIPALIFEGIAVGEHAHAGALRYFARGDLADEPQAEPVLRRYLEAALLTLFATRRLIRQQRIEVACFHHGIYVPQGIIGEVCRSEGVRVVNWNVAYRTRCFIFSHGDTYHHTMMDEPLDVWEQIPWTPAIEAETLEYLKSRWQGTRDWIFFHEKPQEDLEQITREIGIDFAARPTIGMLTNVMWDAQLHYPANAFPNMLDWVLRTIAYFARRPELQLLIRVHPAELRGLMPSRQPIIDEIRRAFPALPPNVYIIPPESSISTYAAMLQCDSVIIYGTKTGVELSSLGIPIIVAGEAWIRGKGLTIDAPNAEEYFTILDRLPLGRRLDEPTIQRARKYAYHFFFRRMIPIGFIAPTTARTWRNAFGWWPYDVQIERIDELAPGRDRGLDVICDGILTGAPFIYPAEASSSATQPAATATQV